MKLEDQVCSLELAKRLKELGVRQESLYKWIQKGDSPDDWSQSFLEISSTAEKRSFYVADGYCSAFTVAELGEMSPVDIWPHGKRGESRGYILREINHGYEWFCYYESLDNYRYWADEETPHSLRGFKERTEAGARAKMLIYLIENKLMTVNREEA